MNAITPITTAIQDALANAQPAVEAGHVILNDIHAFIGRFVAYPSEHARIAHALWIAHTHLMDAWDSTPRIAFLSPEPASGKSRALEVTETLVPRAVEAVNVTPAYLFRKVGADGGRPTIPYDEIDTVFGPKAKDNEEIRGLLNAGHRKHSVAGRCVVRGKEVFTEEIPAYCAVALAGLGGLPDTILSRSVIVRMRRRAPSERVEPYRRRVNGPDGEGLGERLTAWAESIAPNVSGVYPAMPDGVQDRDADVWEALLAIADAAGGDWPKLGRAAAVALVAESKQTPPSLGVRLLADLRRVFDGHDALSTDAILKALDSRGLSNRLRPYEIKPKQVRIGNITLKGYSREMMFDAWQRYLSPAAESETSETSGTNPANGDANVSGVSDVSDFAETDRGRPTPYFDEQTGETVIWDGGHALTPTARTLSSLRADGWTAEVVERWNPHARVRHDLFNIADVLAVRGREPLAVQVTAGSGVSARVRKLKGSPALPLLTGAGWRVEIHGWRKVKVRRGGRTTRWACRIINMRATA